MNKLPGFTAEGSLYKTSGHYRNGKPAFASLTQAIRAFRPAAEVIEVHGCPPGTIPWIEGETAVCILTEPSWDDSGQSPGGDGGFGDTEPYGGGGGKRPPKKKGRPESKPKPKPKPRKYGHEHCTEELQKTEKYRQCQEKSFQDLQEGKEFLHAPVCDEESSEVLCCIDPGKGILYCDAQKV